MMSFQNLTYLQLCISRRDLASIRAQKFDVWFQVACKSQRLC